MYYSCNGVWFDPAAFELQQRTRALKRDSNVFAVATILSALGLQLLLGVILGVLEIMPFTSGVLDFIQTPYGALLTQGIYTTVAFSLPFLAAAAIAAPYDAFGRKRLEIFPPKKVRPQLLLAFVGVGVGFSVVDNLLVDIYYNLLSGIGVSMDYSSIEIPDGVLGSVAYLLVLSVLPAIFEEFAFRGVVMGALKKHGRTVAIIGSSALFGLMHGNLVQIPFAFALGCVFAYIDLLCDSIWPSVIVHFLNNFTAGVVDLVSVGGNDLVTAIVSSLIIFAFAAAGAVAFVWLCRKYRRAFAPFGVEALTRAKSVGAFFSSAGVIIALIVFGGEALVISLL